MARTISRILLALMGSSFGAVLVALVEAHQAAQEATGSHANGYGVLLLAETAVLAPLAVVLGLAVVAASVFLEPGSSPGPVARIAALRAAPPVARSRTAALALLAGGLGTAWLVITAQTAEGLVGRGAPAAAGGALAVTSLAWLAALGAAGLAVLPSLRRGLVSASSRFPRALDPAMTAAAGLLFGALVVAIGVHTGGTGGEGPGPIAIFGVLKRPELDVRPVVELAAIAAAAFIAQLAFSGGGPHALVLAIAPALVGVPLWLTVAEATALERDPSAARDIERHASLGRIALSILRKATDRDHDGASPYFGGGDCDDTNPNISPFAIEIPGNGVDEDCSGSEVPGSGSAPRGPAGGPAVGAAVVAPDPASGSGGSSATASASAATLSALSAIEGDYNLILVTVDTLRASEMGFLGYEKPTTPNLDALASRAVVYERAYSMASYTGKALAPMLIGKYPSETVRDGGHFNRYAAANTLLAERLKSVGVFTMGAASHWYFREQWGLTQGFDVFDLSSIPAEGQGAATDSTTTSAQLTDATLRLLSRHAGNGRFFLWVHYFDPHEQYVAHPGAPDFNDEPKHAGGRMRAAYDGEVWFTDRHIGRLLDYARGQPWWKNTVVVVTSDHGEAMTEHGMAFQHGFEIWEPLVRVPLLVYVPGVASHRVPVKRSVIDLVPTLLDLMRVQQPPAGDLSGQSMLADLAAHPGDAYAERDVFIDMPDGPYTHMRRGLIHGPTPGMKLIHFGGRQYQLYDLAVDPEEREDLAGDPSKLGPMIQALQEKRAGLHEIYVKPDVVPP